MRTFFNGGLSSQTTQLVIECDAEVKWEVVALSRVDNMHELPQRRIKSTEASRYGWMRDWGHVSQKWGTSNYRLFEWWALADCQHWLDRNNHVANSAPALNEFMSSDGLIERELGGDSVN